MRIEILAGVTTFITIAYILILNPQILADPYMIMGDAAMAEKISNGVFIGTCIGAFIGTILCALYAKVPFAQAPGMGLNAFFAYTVVLGMGYTYNEALVIVFISGIFFIVITAVGLREAIIRSIPDAVKMAITPGIGLFITIIGLKNAGLVVGNQATLVSMVDFSQWRSEDGNVTLICGALVDLVGLIVIGVLHSRNVKGSILYGIAAATIVGIPLGVTKLSAFDMNIGAKFHDFAEVSFLKMDFGGMFSGKNPVDTILTVVMLVISFSLVNMFDSIGTLMGAAKQSGMTSLVTAVLFLASIIFAPIVGIVPGAATAPALIFVGILMLSNIKDIDFSDMTIALPAFCTVVFMPFTYSIANGVVVGLIMYCLIKLFTAKASDVKVLTWIISIVFIFRYAIMTLG